MRVRVAHASMKFADTNKQHEHDAQKIFAHCQERQVRWITGTESGPGAGNLNAALAKAAWGHGYHFFTDPSTDGWIGVDRSFTRGGFRGHYKKLFDGQAHRFPDRGIVSMSFKTEQLGRINVATAHYFTKGRKPGDPFFPWNVRYIDAVNRWARSAGKGKQLAFYGGDQNLVDRDSDTFHGGPLTSLWDELHEHDNTGHGNIDVIASYDFDGRVTGKSIEAYTDAEFQLFSDHYFVEGSFEVKPL